MSNVNNELLMALNEGQPFLDICHLAKQSVLKIIESSDQIKAAWHPYGFLVTRLCEDSILKISLRLHIWPQGSRSRQVPDWPIHSHPWDLESSIICGETINSAYRVSLEPNSDHLLYRVGYEGNNSVLEKTDTFVRSTIISRQTHTSGEKYLVSTDEYHVTDVPPERFTATLVLTKNPKNDPPYVVGEAGHAKRYEYERRYCSPSLLFSLNKTLHEILQHQY